MVNLPTTIISIVKVPDVFWQVMVPISGWIKYIQELVWDNLGQMVVFRDTNFSL